ncbi:hypothetical protein Golob_014367 [Gossypium lobatum]|uniref:Terpene synthase metal-binding domain-containing protein n=1 Tax=Gossypium lobatum TaxID=34289 RepID=A0A7J8LY32_9ROSI|nr:hypothetical protein [Gossypium lobatum]
MHETGRSEEEAREHIKKLIDVAWKNMNKDHMAAKSLSSQMLFATAMNLARVSMLVYQNDDGHGIEDGEPKERALRLFIQSIPLPK